MLLHTVDSINSKLVSYGLNNTALKLLYSYLKDGKQYFPISNIYSNFEDVISGVRQDEIVDPLILTYQSMIYFSLLILLKFIISLMIIPFLHGQTVSNLTNNFQSDSKSQYSMKKIIVNPNKSEATLLYEKLLDHANPKFRLYIQAIK